MVLTENIKEGHKFPTSRYNDLIMNEEENSQNQTEGNNTTNLASSTNDENTESERVLMNENENNISISNDANDTNEETKLLQNNNSWDYIKTEEINSIPDNVNFDNCEKLWNDVKRASQKLAIDVRTKAEELDEKYKIQEKARPYVRNVQTFAESTRNVIQEQNIPTKAKHASEEATRRVRKLDDEYGVVDKVSGAAVGIGAIQMASGHFKSGAVTLIGAALVAAFGEKLKKDREDEKELHLY